MKLPGIAAAVLMMAAMCVAQMPAGHGETSGVVPSSRTDFGAACGISDTSTQNALSFVRSRGGEWSATDSGRGGGPNDNMLARLWRETNWMVDIHSALGEGMSTMHTGQMCFDSQGRITRMIDRYMEVAECSCMRFTSLTFAPDGRTTRREQRFVNAMTGEEIQPPQVAQGFPDIWEYRKVEQLPFFSLIKK